MKKLKEIADKYCHPAQLKAREKFAKQTFNSRENKNIAKDQKKQTTPPEQDTTPTDYSHLTLKEAQALRNQQYFEDVKAGLRDDNPPMPKVLHKISHPEKYFP